MWCVESPPVATGGLSTHHRYTNGESALFPGECPDFDLPGPLVVSAARGEPVAVEVSAAPAIQGPQSGRILVFARRVEPGAPASTEIDSSAFEPTGTAVAGREVQALNAGGVAIVDGETDAFPTPFSRLPPGTYRFQAVLDRNHDYNYGGRGGGDIVSPVVEARLPGPARHPDHRPDRKQPMRRGQRRRRRRQQFSQLS